MDINSVTVTFASPVASIGSLIVYDGSGAQIGTATAVIGSSTQFHAAIPFGKLVLPYRQQRSLSVTARLNGNTTGGMSGEDVQVQTMTVEGEGRWSNEAYASSSNDTFNASETAFARITGIANTGIAEGVLISGPGKVLADLTVTADTPESQHEVRITSLTFTIEQAGGITLSNVALRTEDGSASSPCTVGSTTVLCAAIDASVGTVDMSRRMRLVGDVLVPGAATKPSLRLVLNQPGTSATAGDITWSDGSATFSWVDLDQPVVGGTIWR